MENHSSGEEQVEKLLTDPSFIKQTFNIWQVERERFPYFDPPMQQAHQETIQKALPFLASCKNMRDLVAAYNLPEMFCDEYGQDWLIAAYRATKAEGGGAGH